MRDDRDIPHTIALDTLDIPHGGLEADSDLGYDILKHMMRPPESGKI